MAACRGQQYELLDWLENVTFPMESRFADEELAKRIYPSVVNKFINSGVRAKYSRRVSVLRRFFRQQHVAITDHFTWTLPRCLRTL